MKAGGLELGVPNNPDLPAVVAAEEGVFQMAVIMFQLPL